MKKTVQMLRDETEYMTTLPVGMTQFEEWVQTIENEYELPTAHKDSVRFAFATMILNLKEDTYELPLSFFVKRLWAASAKQIAGAVFHDIKIRQKQEQEAEAKKLSEQKLAEVISVSSVISNENQTAKI